MSKRGVLIFYDASKSDGQTVRVDANNFSFQLEPPTLATGWNGQCQVLPDGHHIRGFNENAPFAYVLYGSFEKPVAGGIEDRSIERASRVLSVILSMDSLFLPHLGRNLLRFLDPDLAVTDSGGISTRRRVGPMG